ncbi:MAG: hypothetical protein IMF06_02145, partial [Proteobacteria bacterium]|nr:hypothetical protein [Pseudomonadota bacterium]
MSDVKESASPEAAAAAANALPADGTLLTARGVRSRMALLNAARTMFKTKGYANTTIVDITG